MTPPRIFNSGNSGATPIIGRQEPQGVKMEQGKCAQITILLNGKSYFCEDANIRTGQAPPFPIYFPKLYSELTLDGKVQAIQRHDDMVIFATGLTMETVAEPAWWRSRDERTLAI